MKKYLYRAGVYILMIYMYFVVSRKNAWGDCIEVSKIVDVVVKIELKHCIEYLFLLLTGHRK